MKILKYGMGGIVILLLLATASIYTFLELKQPQRSGELVLPGLQSKVEVFFDQWAIPHIYADNESDVYQSLGYLHAQDRLFQMEMLRRLAKGQLAEILGASLVKVDRFFRTLRIKQFSQEFAESMDSATPEYAAIQSYLAGVNHFIKTGPIPIEFQILGITQTPFQLSDIVSIAAYMAYSFSVALKTDPLLTSIRDKYGNSYLKDLGFEGNPASVAISKETAQSGMKVAKLASEIESYASLLGRFVGSNAWAISGDKTKSGKPIFANDPHIPFSQPSVWYEAHLVTPQFELYGHHLGGVPTALLGHNRQMAWGLSMFQNDDIDLFQERVNPNNPNQIWSNGMWEDLKIEEEIIKVKGESDIHLQIRQSKHGPILNDVVDGMKGQSQPISMWWGFYQKNNRIFKGFYDLAHAQSLKEAETAASYIHAPGLNIMYSDVDGNIAWWAVGSLPIRPSHVNPNFILDGASGKDDYLGFLDFSKNPHSVNPDSGLIVSANHRPQDQGNGVPAGYYNVNARHLRLQELLGINKTDWTMDDIKKVQLDIKTGYARSIQDQIIPILESQPDIQNNEIAKQALQRLKEWQGNHDLQEVGPTLLFQFLYDFTELTFKDELGEDDFKIFIRTRFFYKTLPKILQNPDSKWWDNLETESKETRNEIVTQAWMKSIKLLTKEHGEDPNQWHWSKVHTLEHVHAIGRKKPFDRIFNVGPFEVAGGKEIVNNLSFRFTSGLHRVYQGPSTRRVIDFGNPENSWGINPTGQAGYFFNKHYDDQAQMYVDGIHRQQLMNREDIINQQESRLMLIP